jgi:Chalcone isomerase-like
MSCSSPCTAPERALRRALLRAAAGALVCATLPAAAADGAVPAEVGAALPGAKLQGQGRLRYFGLHVYDAVLWALSRPPEGEAQNAPLALELRYARTLRGPLIAERSIEEMKRVGEFGEAEAVRWLEAMKRLFPDVNAGDRITGVNRPGEGAAFYVNGRAVGEVRDARFAQLFFGIWLSPRTSEPALRAALLGARP